MLNSEICMNCGICCENTEMELSEKDINRIIRITRDTPNLKQFYIIDKKTGEKLLRNVDGRCIFQNPKTLTCIIYENRPEGCKFYPLIYDFQKRNCVLDSECPHKELFELTGNERKKRCNLLKSWVFRELLKK